MKIFLSLLLLAPACVLTPDGRAVSLAEAREAIESAADDVALADLNGDGMLQLDSRSGLPLPALQAYLRGSAEDLLASDSNGDGLLDGREMLGAAPTMAARLYLAAESLGRRPADGERGELGMLGMLLANRVMQAMR